MSGETNDKNRPNGDTFIKTKAKEIIFLTSVAGMSICFGFGLTIALTKKKDPHMFNKGLLPANRGIAETGDSVPESGGSLALRALAWGTLYSITGVGVLSFGIWKLLGMNNMKEFTANFRSMMPKPKKNDPPGKSDFKTVRELVKYIEDDRKD